MATDWLKLIGGTSPVLPARMMYQGRAFAFVRQSADLAGADLGVISAGLGYIPAQRMIPPYNATTEHGDSALCRLINDWNPRRWWHEIRRSGYSSSIPVHEDRQILIVLTAPYARLIADDLDALAIHPERVRIFGRGISKLLPGALRASLMPYDDRLETVGRRGVMGDFGARALSHFLSTARPRCDRMEDARYVRASLDRVGRGSVHAPLPSSA